MSGEIVRFTAPLPIWRGDFGFVRIEGDAAWSRYGTSPRSHTSATGR